MLTSLHCDQWEPKITVTNQKISDKTGLNPAAYHFELYLYMTKNPWPKSPRGRNIDLHCAKIASHSGSGKCPDCQLENAAVDHLKKSCACDSCDFVCCWHIWRGLLRWQSLTEWRKKSSQEVDIWLTVLVHEKQLCSTCHLVYVGDLSENLHGIFDEIHSGSRGIRITQGENWPRCWKTPWFA